MAWTIFEVSLNLFQGFLFQRFMLSRLHTVQKHELHDVLCIVATTLFYTVTLYFAIPFADVVVFVIPLCYALLIAGDKWYVSVFWTVILAILFLAVTSVCWYIATTMLGGSHDLLMDKTGMRVVFVLLTNALLTLTLYLTSKIKKEYSALYWPVFMLFLLTMATLFVIEESLYALQLSGEFGKYANRLSFLWAYIGLCACIIFVILLFHRMAQSMERESFFREEANAIAQSRQYQQELAQLYGDLRATKHDLKQHIQTLEEMVRIGNSKEARDYLAAYEEGINSESVFLTGSSAVDALLATKHMTMKENRITFHHSLYPLDCLPIRAPDFCTILGNLLDNAIEGTLRTPKDCPLTIQLTFSRSQDMFYIYCSNPCDLGTLKKEKGRWLSSKTTKDTTARHAIGIRSMERIVDEAEGRCHFEVKNSMFLAKVVLPYQSTEEEIAHDTNSSECNH